MATFPDEISTVPSGRSRTLSNHPRLRDFLSYLNNIRSIFVAFAFILFVIYLVMIRMFTSLGLSPAARDAVFVILIGVTFVWLVVPFFREDDSEEEGPEQVTAPRRAALAWNEAESVEPEAEDEDFEVEYDDHGHEIRAPLRPEPQKGDARSMLRRAIEAAPAPTSSATVIVGPRILAFYTWLFLAAAVLLTVLVHQGSPYNRYWSAGQIAFVISFDFLAVTTVLIWTLRRRVVADATGIRQVVAGRTVEMLPWERVKRIEYGIRRCNTSKRTYRAAGFIDIRDRRRWQTVYADSVYYSINTKTLGRFARFIVEEAARHGVRAKYVDEHWPSDWL